jgi:hypothetical protein
MFINDSVNLKCLLTWFSNFIALLHLIPSRSCWGKKWNRKFFRILPTSSDIIIIINSSIQSIASVSMHVKRTHKKQSNRETNAKFQLPCWVAGREEKRKSEKIIKKKSKRFQHTPQDIIEGWKYFFILFVSLLCGSRSLPHDSDVGSVGARGRGEHVRCSFTVCWCKNQRNFPSFFCVSIRIFRNLYNPQRDIEKVELELILRKFRSNFLLRSKNEHKKSFWFILKSCLNDGGVWIRWLRLRCEICRIFTLN